MNTLSRFQYRLRAALKAFNEPGIVRSAKGWGGGYGYTGGGSSDLSTGNNAMWSKWGAATALLVNHAVFACVTKRAETVTGLKYRIVDKATRKPLTEAAQKQDPLLRAIDLYSRHYGGQSLFQEWMYERDITGEVYLEPLRNEYSGRVMGLDLLSSLNVTPWSADGLTISYFEYQAGTYTSRIPTNRLIYDRSTIARMSSINGYSPVLVAVGNNAAGIMQASGKAVLAYFNNDGIPGTTIMPKQGESSFSLDEVDKIRRVLQPVKNASGKYATAIIPNSVEFFQAQQPDLLKWAELLRAVEPQIYTAFRTPRSVAGDSDSTSYQASPNDKVNFDAVIRATASDIALTVNTSLAPLFYDDPEPSVEFEFETAELDHIPDEERQAARDAWETGACTLNEYREWIGLEAVAGGDVYQKRIGAEYITADAFMPKLDPVMPTPPQETITVETPRPPEPPTPPQLPAEIPARSEIDELDRFGKFIRNGNTKRAFVWNIVDEQTGACIESDIALSTDALGMKSVLSTWHTALSARAGLTDYATKSLDDLPDATRTYIKSLQSLGYAGDVWHKAGADHYARVTGIKSLSNVRARFEAACLQLMRRAVDERIGKARFARDMEVTLFRYARLALIEGYADGGIDDYEPDEDDDRYLLAFNDEQRAYIQNVANALYADDVLTDDEVKGKPQMWFNKSVHPAYSEGLTRASKDGIGVYYMGPTEDKCADCPRLHLQARKFSTWIKYLGRELVPSGATECGGFRCECTITPRQTAISRGSLPRLVGYRKAVTTGIDLEVIRA